jgi:hypothetical protein
MVRIEGNKIIIEIEQTSPEEFYQGLMRDMISCIQGLSESDLDVPLQDSISFVLELYKAILPDQEQVNKMFGKKATT